MTPQDLTVTFHAWAASLSLDKNGLNGKIPLAIGRLSNLGEFVDALIIDVLSSHLSHW